jgi:hypothetical protein
MRTFILSRLCANCWKNTLRNKAVSADLGDYSKDKVFYPQITQISQIIIYSVMPFRLYGAEEQLEGQAATLHRYLQFLSLFEICVICVICG